MAKVLIAAKINDLNAKGLSGTFTFKLSPYTCFQPCAESFTSCPAVVII